MPKFSVIIPVFNAEKTLARCLDSVAAQTLENFEAIVVDNGSCDGSRDIIREYSARDRRFKLIEYFERRGPSAARNRALEIACGQYIAFVDSDDSVDKDWLFCMNRAFETKNADAVFIGFNNVDVNGNLLESRSMLPLEFSLSESSARLYLDDMFGYTWIKAFRRDVISDIRFCEDISLLEDEIFACEVICRCECICTADSSLYNYTCGRDGQLTGQLHSDFCRAQTISFDMWERLLHGTSAERYLSEIAEKKLLSCMYFGFERKVNVNKFFKELYGSGLLGAATEETPFVDALRSMNVAKLRRLRRRYRLKNKLYLLLRR